MGTANRPTGVELIAAERQRQMGTEGYDEKKDDEHRHSELAIAAACYAVHQSHVRVVYGSRDGWPWDEASDKRAKHPPIRRLAIAGALIAAEIDRLHPVPGFDE